MREPPAGFRRHDTARFGFSVAVPSRFHYLANTVDPVAFDLRGCGEERDAHEADGERHEPGCETHEADGEERWPKGVWDPEVIGELEDGRVQPLRILEFDAIGPRAEAVPPDLAGAMWFQARQMLPEVLASGGLPGYCLLDVADTTLGSLDALAFEYTWDGLPSVEGDGDHALLVWAPSPLTVFHVYHHCVEAEWAARRAELDAILGTFEVLEPGCAD
jgi:hypothetical protein